MKKLLSLILCMWMALSGSSQTFKPLVQLDGNDTFLCFNLAQSRQLAKELVKSRYCDSIHAISEVKIGQLCELTQFKDSAIFFLKEQIIVQDCALEKSDQIILQQEQGLNTISDRLTKMRLQRTVLLVCSVLLSASLILK